MNGIEAIPSGRKTRAFYARHSALIARRRRTEVVDPEYGRSGAAKGERMSLGIALLHCIALPGVCYTRQEIAAWAGSTEAAIYQIERRALWKLRQAFAGPLRTELLRELLDETRPARQKEAA